MNRRACGVFISVLMLGVFCSCEETLSPPSDESGTFWEVSRDPQVYSYWITGSSGSSSSGIYIVNQNGIVLLFKDAKFSMLPALPAGRDWNGIWADPPHDIFAVGDGGAIARYKNRRWEEQIVESTSDLYGVWGRSGNDVWVVGDSGTVLHYDGSGWSAPDAGTGSDLNDVWGLDQGPVFAVGEGGTIVEAGDYYCRTFSAGTTNSLYAIHGTSENDLCAVGLNGTIIRYDGHAWNGVRSGFVTGLTSVCAAGDGQIYAAGGTTLLRYDGRVWELYDIGFDDVAPWSGVIDLYGNVAGGLMAVGRDKIYSFEKGAWKTIELPPSDENAETLVDLWGGDGDDVYALNARAISRYDGIGWSMFTDISSIGLDCNLSALWGTSSLNMYAVGWAPVDVGYPIPMPEEGMLIAHYDGAGVHVEEIGNALGDIRDIWGSSENDIFAVGRAGIVMNGGATTGAILHYDGIRWSTMECGIDQTLFAVWGNSFDDVFAAGGGGTILHYDGMEWSPQESGVGAPLSGLWGIGPSDVFAVGSGGDGAVILHYDGMLWSIMDSPAVPSLNAVWGTSGENVFAAGDYGTILRYDGAQWTAMDSPTGRSLYSIWGSSADDIFVAGENGVVLHHGAR